MRYNPGMSSPSRRRVDAYLEIETDAELRATAKSLDRSVTWCVRRAVEEWLEAEKRRRPWPSTDVATWPERKKG